MKLLLLAFLSLGLMNTFSSDAFSAVNELIPGGFQESGVTEPDVVYAATFAVKEINARSNSLTPYVLAQILSAKFQVVAGMNYTLELKILHGKTIEIHNVVVYSRPWEGFMALTKDTLFVEPLAGGFQEISLDDSELLSMVDFAVAEINARNVSEMPYELMEVLAAKTQVVAGMNYSIALKLKHGDAIEVHNVVVFSQAWAKVLELTSDDIAM